MKTVATPAQINEAEKKEATARARELSKAIYKEADSLKKELEKGFRVAATQHAAQERKPGETRDARTERLKSNMRAVTENAVNKFLKDVGLDTQITFEMVEQWRKVKYAKMGTEAERQEAKKTESQREAAAKAEADKMLREILKKGERPKPETEIQELIYENTFESKADAVLSTCNQIFYQAEALAKKFDESREYRSNIGWEITKSVALIITAVTAFVGIVAIFLAGAALLAAGGATLNAPLALTGAGIAALSIAMGYNMPSDIAKFWETFKGEVSEARTGISALMEKEIERRAGEVAPPTGLAEGTDPLTHYSMFAGTMANVALSLQSYCESHLKYAAQTSR